MTKKAILAILDGYGYAPAGEFNAVTNAGTPFLDSVMKENAVSLLKCSGREVGLPEGQMGNSEVGHLNIGAGRVVSQDLSRILIDIEEGTFYENPVLVRACESALEKGGALHLCGLVSDGGVHSDITHIFALVKLAKLKGVRKVYIHCFMDGRDTPPSSGEGYTEQLEAFLKEEGLGRIATVSGRYYAMDRDSNWDRIAPAWNAMVNGEGKVFPSASAAVRSSYGDGKTDEFIVPCVIEGGGTVQDGDSVIFFNFRADRARQLTRAFTEKEFGGFDRKTLPEVNFVCMTLYDASLKNLSVAYAPEELKNTLGEYLSSLGVTQLRIAETEKYAHVTYFFNGGIETQYPYEERILVPSPKVATYDLKPEMSAYEVTDRLTEALDTGKYDLVVVNYANCDMVGHTGVYEAAVKAVESVDACVKKVFEAAKKNGYTMMITADHGNAEVMMEDGVPFTAHTTNDVIFTVLDPSVGSLRNGALKDIAPTVLSVMGIEVPPEMTGECLTGGKER